MYPTVLEVLNKWAIEQPNNVVWNFLDDKGDIIDKYTYYELEVITNELATYLLSNPYINLKDRVLLVFFPGIYFTISLIACFKADLVAVPVFPPDPRKLKKDFDHFISIQSNSNAVIALTHNSYNYNKKLAYLKNIFSSNNISRPDLKWITVDDVISRHKNMKLSTLPDPIALNPDSIAFLQYTSGSTSEPKGVMISHSNLSHNLTLIINELKADQSTRNVSWLPQYHDMGLIGSYLGLLYCGGIGFYLSPISFLKDPLVWIKALSKYQGTHSQAPSFAYALVVRKYKEYHQRNKSYQSLQFDLSSVKHLINAAEPVDCAAVLDFHDTFSKFGLKPDVVKPTYGLAEHTVFVCSGGNQILTLDKAALENDVVEIIQHSTIETIVTNKSIDSLKSNNDRYINIVGCGYPFNSVDVDLIIVDKEKLQPQSPLLVGEVWIRSPSKAQGYWKNPKQTLDDFNATLPGSNATYLRTGDLGFLYENELFICGRLKDLIIVRGTNHYPQDIERTGEMNENLRAGCSAAFAVKFDGSDTEAVIYVAEIKDKIDSEYESIVESCKLKISTEHGIALSSILLLKTRSIPKTTSGKIARSWCKRGFLNNTLEVVYRWDSPNNNSGDTPFDDFSKKDTNNYESDNLVDSNSIRTLPLSELSRRLQSALMDVASASPTPLSIPIDTNSSLSSLGLDSLTIAQFKGILENQYKCYLPDEYYFTNLCTINELCLAVQIGELTPKQKQMFDNMNNSDEPNNVVVIDHKEHLCPWFVWCC